MNVSDQMSFEDKSSDGNDKFKAQDIVLNDRRPTDRSKKSKQSAKK